MTPPRQLSRAGVRLRQVRRRLKYGDTHVRDIAALQNLASLDAGYLPWTVSSLRPATIEQVLNDIVLNERRVVVELGSGISTVLIAALARSGIALELYSVDESQAWLDRVSDRVVRLASPVRYNPICAPLAPFDARADLPVARWYDVAAFAGLPEQIDLVVCDGPTAFTPDIQYDRWPALPALHSRLSPRCALVLDDTSRPGESRVAAAWARAFPDFEVRTQATVTWFVRGHTWNT